MKIIKRDIYKRYKDELFCEVASEHWAKELVKVLNSTEKYKEYGKYYQLVDDDFEIK